MNNAQTIIRDRLPSFSIVLETENLATAKLEGLAQAIAALARQEMPPTEANEVLLIDTGDAPADLLQQLCQSYPWLTVYRAPTGIEYHEVKMLGAEQATGEIVVYYDCDCWYEPHWLRSLLTPFSERSDVDVVAGETITRGVGPYRTAMALTYIFPQYSGRKTLTPSEHYYLNNVAFRRSFLLSHPIPLDLPLYRGNCAIHANELLQQGYTIWQQPAARATHPPPETLQFFIWRFLLIGHDFYWQGRLLAKASRSGHPSYIGFLEQLRIFGDRIRKMVVHDPRHLLFLPLSIPVVAVSVALIFIGHTITRLKSDVLLKGYERAFGSS